MNKNKLMVHFNDEAVGILVYKDRKVSFQYNENWIKNGFSISPLSLPLSNKIYTPEFRPFSGLFGIFNDSLPDGWGRLLLDRMLLKSGIRPNQISQIDRLAIVGKEGMGALEYTPEDSFQMAATENYDLDFLSKQCSLILEDKESNDLDYLFQNGGSSGGESPKINKEIDGDEWIIKFPSSIDSEEIGLQEYLYSECARKCGLEIPETRLFNSKICDGYFGIKRFDREGKNKIHMASVSALLESSHMSPNLDYIQLLKLTMFLCKSEKEVRKMFDLMCFNVFSQNQDDHSKNFSFIYDGCWKLSPAYDLTKSSTMYAEHATTVAGEGKNPGLKDILKVADEIGISTKYAKESASNIQEHVMQDLFKYLD